MASYGKELDGKVAVVTGAGSGIGAATAERLARAGAEVHGADLQGADHTLDVTDRDAVRALADSVFERSGRVDILHSNAGIGHAGPTEDVPDGLWRKIVDVNLMGVVHGVEAFGQRMLEQAGGGHIVNTASLAGLIAVPEMVPYATTKHAVVGLSESLNAEWSPRGVKVTAVCPGFINTPITRSSTLTGAHAARREEIVGFYERFGVGPEKVADAVFEVVTTGAAPIRTVPRLHVVPAWIARRISPRAAQPVARLSQRLVNRG